MTRLICENVAIFLASRYISKLLSTLCHLFNTAPPPLPPKQRLLLLPTHILYHRRRWVITVSLRHNFTILTANNLLFMVRNIKYECLFSLVETIGDQQKFFSVLKEYQKQIFFISSRTAAAFNLAIYA